MAGELIQRDLEKKLRESLDAREILAVLGPRQSGKTTLLEKIHNSLENSEFLTFEDQKILNLFENDIDAFINAYVKGRDYLFIDEVQYAKNGGKNLKYIYDTQKVKVLISGSSAPGVSIHSLKYLVGRVFINYLYPCSFREFLRFRDPNLLEITDSKHASELLLPLYKEFAVYGGYPRVVISEKLKDKKEVLANIYNTYLLREIKEIMQVTSVFSLEKLAKALALQIGGLVNYSEISEITGLPYRDIIKNLDILENTFVCKRALPFYSNRRTELTKTPKVFFYDNGLRNSIIGEFAEMGSRSDAGNLNENFVASELIKAELPLNYWRTKSKAEVDFIVKGIPIEVKSSLSSERTTKSLMSFLEKHKSRRAIMASYDLKSMKKVGSCDIYYEPLYNILKILTEFFA
jgi:predicted AAA+ superfamily ATPase